MNIWRWVYEVQDELAENGRARLAELVKAIPGYVVNHEHARLDAVVPEALALAREAKSPWLEVFIRHWNLQSRILHRHEVAAFLPEAVRLLELTSRDEARECPQSVCVTQDLAGCYSKIDGPGFVAERLSVAGETLSRIDARWPCFTCISAEYATALVDRRDPEGALAFLDTQAAELARVGRARAAHNLAGARIEALFALKRWEQGLAEATRAREEANDENDRVSHGLDCAVALAALGRPEEAAAALCSFETTLPTHSLYDRWSEAVTELALAGARPNDWRLDAQLGELGARLTDNGVIRLSIALQRRRARLALARDRAGTAEHAAAAIRALVPRLRASLGEGAELEALDEAIANARAAAPPLAPAGSVEMALASLASDPELDVEALRAARARFPDEERLALVEASALRALRREGEADALLRGWLAAHPDAQGCLMTLGQALLDRHRPDEARALGEGALREGAPPAMQVAAHFLIAMSLRQAGERAKARPHLVAMLAIEPGELRIELLLAALDRDDGALDAALERLDRLVVTHPKPGPHDWDRMVTATLLGRWDAVRDSGRRVGMKLEGEGPIDEAWAICRIELAEADGTTTVHHALRTGPVTARILEIGNPRGPQHYGDEVVFEATPKNPPKAEGEQDHTFLYPAIRVRAPGGYRAFLLDGAHPGEEALAALKEELRALGGVLSIRSDESYRLPSPTAGEQLPGLFAYLAVPAGLPLADVHAILTRRSAAWAHPLVWPGLAQELELEDEIARQAEIIDLYRL